MTDPWFEDYRRARQRRLPLVDAPAPSDEVRSTTCPWCHQYARHVVERIGAAEGPLAVVVRRCTSCGRSTSRLE
jgi:hypothetical protein